MELKGRFRVFKKIHLIVGVAMLMTGILVAANSIAPNVSAAQVQANFNTNIPAGDLGYSNRVYSVNLGNQPAGTTLDVTWTFTNTTGKPVILLPTTTNTTKIYFLPAAQAANITLVSENIPGKDLVPPAFVGAIDPADLGPVTLQPNQALTVTFEAAITNAVTNPTANLALGVGGVYDQVWNYNDFYSLCGYLSGPASIVVNASDPEVNWALANNIRPDCAYMQGATFLNDLSYPVTINYVGYTDSGFLAPYVSGTLCDMTNCGNEWNDVTLQPGESSEPFTMLVGMPWFVANESMNTTGSALFRWTITPSGELGMLEAVDDQATGNYGAIISLDVLANDTLPEGTILSAVVGDGNGIWSIVDGKVQFVPNEGFFGIATATYTVTAPDSRTTTAKVTITIRPEILSPGTGVYIQQPTSGVAATSDVAIVVLALGLVLFLRRVWAGSQ